METSIKDIVLRPTATIQISNRFSLVERKLLNVIIWDSQRHRFDQGERNLLVSNVFQLLGLEKSHNTEVLKEALRKLTGTIIEWNGLGVDRTQEWGVCTFLASGKIIRGRMKYRLNPEILHKINTPTLFAKIQLLIESQFRKRHALVLYEFFLDYRCRGKEEELLGVQLEMIHALLGLGDTKYIGPGTYKFFNRDVLKPSIQEINEHTDMTVSYSPVRKSRKVVALSFGVERKESFQLAFDLKPEDVSVGVGLTHEGGVEGSGKQLIKLLIDKGISERKAKGLVNTYEPDRIRGNIEHVNALLEGDHAINNTEAYLVRAIEEDYRPKTSPEEQRHMTEIEAVRRARLQTEARNNLEKEWKDYRSRRLREMFAQQPKKWQERRKTEFVERIKQDAQQGDGIVYSLYRKSNFDSAVVEASFLVPLADELLIKPEENDLDAYIAWCEQNQVVGEAV